MCIDIRFNARGRPDFYVFVNECSSWTVRRKTRSIAVSCLGRHGRQFFTGAFWRFYLISLAAIHFSSKALRKQERGPVFLRSPSRPNLRRILRRKRRVRRREL